MGWVVCTRKPLYQLAPAENDIDSCAGTGRNIYYILHSYTNTTLWIKKLKKLKLSPGPAPLSVNTAVSFYTPVFSALVGCILKRQTLLPLEAVS